MGKSCAIISGGVFAPLSGIEQADVCVACDKGVEYALRCGCRPALLVGDFDSYAGELPEGIPVLELPVEKDDTDTMAAIRWAIDAGFEELTIYCALGGRLDHLLGNLQAAVFAVQHGARVHICGEGEELFLFTNGTIRLEPREGCSLSVLSMTDRCENVCIRGTKYTLEQAEISNAFPIGVSNAWQQTAEISVESGVLMVILSRM